LVAQFVEEYRERSYLDFGATPKLRAIIDEYIDFLETEYFESALYDLLDESYNQFFEAFLVVNLTTPQVEKSDPPQLAISDQSEEP
jgi:hypothetical protein